MKTQQDSKTILFVTQRLSDFIEMRRASNSLRPYGYKSIILFCGVGQKQYDNEVIQAINKSLEAKEIDAKIVKPTYLPKYLAMQMSSRINKLAQFPQKISRLPFTKKTEQIPVLQDSTDQSQKISKKNTISNNVVQFVNKIIRRILSTLKKLIVIQFTLIPLLYYFHLKLYKKVLKEYEINLIILPEDIVGYVSPLLIKAGHNYHIPSLILPYTIANQTEAFQSLKSCSHLAFKKSFSNRMVGFLFKQWVMKDKQHKVLRLPAGHILGHIFTRTSPPDPWMMNSGFANAIAAENEKMLSYYHENGIPLSKLRLVGACYDDYLSQYLLNSEYERAKLYTELNIVSDKPFLLIGGFPNQLVGNPPGFDFANVEEAVDYIAECLLLLKSNFELIIRPHPNYQELGELFLQRGFIVTTIDTARLVALSHAYIAFASATIRWAIACAVPAINYDIFHYEFTDYNAVHGVLNVRTKEGFKEAIQILSDEWHYKRLKNHLDIEKQKWGKLDGNSVSRINHLIEELMQLKIVPRKAM